MSQEFHITVATSPSSQGLAHELRLLKAAVLYADKIRFCSVAASLLTQVVAIRTLSDAQRRDLMLELMRTIGSDDQKSQIAALAALRHKKRKTPDEIIMVMRIEQLLNTAAAEAVQALMSIFDSMGGEQLLEALSLGVVELRPYEVSDTEHAVTQFVEDIRGALASGETYPLLDDATGVLVGAALREGIFSDASAGAKLGRVAGLAVDVLARLPLFDENSFGDIWSVRTALGEPLIAFRCAIVDAAAALVAAPWDPSYGAEVELIFRSRVEPAVQELERQMKKNTVVQNVIASATKPLKPMALGVLLGQFADLADITGVALGVGRLSAVAAGIGIAAVQEHRANIESIEQNQMYFYVAAGSRLRHAAKIG